MNIHDILCLRNGIACIWNALPAIHLGYEHMPLRPMSLYTFCWIPRNFSLINLPNVKPYQISNRARKTVHEAVHWYGVQSIESETMAINRRALHALPWFCQYLPVIIWIGAILRLIRTRRNVHRAAAYCTYCWIGLCAWRKGTQSAT